jgi:hypothetical protein
VLRPPTQRGGRGAQPNATPPEPVNVEGAGRVHELRLENGAWRIAGTIESRPAPNQRLGTAIALAGDVAVIGAPGDAEGHGAAFVFRRSAAKGAWSEATRLVAFSGVRDDAFGSAVAIDGDDVWVGSPVNRGI